MKSFKYNLFEENVEKIFFIYVHFPLNFQSTILNRYSLSIMKDSEYMQWHSIWLLLNEDKSPEAYQSLASKTIYIRSFIVICDDSTYNWWVM